MPFLPWPMAMSGGGGGGGESLIPLETPLPEFAASKVSDGESRRMMEDPVYGLQVEKVGSRMKHFLPRIAHEANRSGDIVSNSYVRGSRMKHAGNEKNRKIKKIKRDRWDRMKMKREIKQRE